MWRWSAALVGAFLIHGMILAIIAWNQLPDGLIKVSHAVPMPGQTVSLLPAQGLEAAVFLKGDLNSLEPTGALLYRIHEDGTREMLGTSHIHPKRASALQFDAVSEPGEYEIVVLDGTRGVASNFDGEYSGAFPSGDGTAGGQFVMRFGIESKSHEVMTATLFEPDKPPANEEPAAAVSKENPVQQPKQQPTPVQPKPTVPRKPVKQAKPDNRPTSPLITESMSPVESAPPETEEPSTIQLTPQDLRVTPLNLAPELLAESAQIAQKNFEEKDVNPMVQAALLSKKRFESAYNADGPVVGIGQRGNSVEHQKDVAEYLALMHKEIHPLWAHGYLIRLDTIYRSPGSRLNNPDLEAVLEITLDSLGKVLDVRIVRSSGITDYDSEAIHVAWNSSPGLPPPNEMRSPNGKCYIHWTFWRDSRQCGVFGVKVYRLENNLKNSVDFSLKAVQAQEKRLGLTPSTLDPDPEPAPSAPANEETVEPLPLPEKINPLED